LGEILEQGSEWAKRTVLEALIDLAASFEPEPGYATVESPGGELTTVAAQLDAAVLRLSGAVRAIATDVALGEKHRAATTALLAQIERIRGASACDPAV
jgi:hypothetical protein